MIIPMTTVNNHMLKRATRVPFRNTLGNVVFLTSLIICGPAAMAGAAADKGRQAMERYGCPACHVIPGVAGANGRVGPPLAGFARRAYIAGVLPNRFAEMARWLRDPPAVKPGTAMPNLGVTAEDAADISLYLQSLN